MALYFPSVILAEITTKEDVIENEEELIRYEIKIIEVSYCSCTFKERNSSS